MRAVITATLALLAACITPADAARIPHPVTSAAVWPAPVGHRQPHEWDLPPKVRREEGFRTPAQRDFDQRLDICRDC